MDLPNQKFFQPSSLLESPFENNTSLYGKTKETNINNNPFVDSFPDPLCKLNLKETSEFVKSLPMSNGSNNNAEMRSILDVSAQQQRRIEAPSTPGRPLFSFSISSSVVGKNLSRKSFPSKWDDAEKWLISTSCHDSPAHDNSSNTIKVSSKSITKQCDDIFKQKVGGEDQKVSKAVPNIPKSPSLGHNDTVGTFNGISSPTDIVLKDKFTESIDTIFPNFRYSEPTKEGFLFRNQASEAMQDACTDMVQHRDIGTGMTPIGSSTTSRCNTPFKSSSPARHNTPASRSGPLALSNNTNGCCSAVDFIQLEECHFSKLKLGTQYDLVNSNWSSGEEEEKEISKSLRHNASQTGDSDCIAATWEEEERNKCCLRFQREEAKIQAWINLENAKAEARTRKLEVKIQKMKSSLEEKLMKRMSVVHRKAEEWRESARQQHLEQMLKASTEQSKKMVNHHKHHHYQFSSHASSCGCFPCNNN